MAILADAESQILVQGITGREAVSFVRDSLDYGAKVAAGVTPGRGGSDVHGVPVYDTVKEAVKRHKIDVAVVAVPAGFAKDAAFEAIENGVPLVVVVTERIPRRDVAQVLELADIQRARVIGPNTMGFICPGKTKVGSVGGPARDTVKAFTPGPVGVMSRSGGMTTEVCNLLTHSGLGQSTAISVGGDAVIGSTFLDLLPLFEQDPETKVVVTFSEPGGNVEAALARYLKTKGTRLPIVSFIAGSFMDNMPGVRFGHAGSIVEGKQDTVAEKARRLREAGVLVADDLSQIPDLVKKALKQKTPRK
ncbi:MAG: CoA-binding protein [Chloroflexi bacterium]|nr:CoA-binding protein [Chloroflexota bacterium]